MGKNISIIAASLVSAQAPCLTYLGVSHWCLEKEETTPIIQNMASHGEWEGVYVCGVVTRTP